MSKESPPPPGGVAAEANAYDAVLNGDPNALAAYRKVATKGAGERATADPPLGKLLRAAETTAKVTRPGEAIVYWMRMEDMRGTSPTAELSENGTHST